jgi:hypothetical protein
VKKLMMIQPGAFGDIIVCAPIAKAYSDAGYDVYWPIRNQFLSVIKSLDYVCPLVLNDDLLDEDWLRSDVIKCLDLYEREEFDYALNLADRGPHYTAQRIDETFEQTKYRLSNISFTEKYNFVWTRNTDNEQSLYDKINPDDTYILAHVTPSNESLDQGQSVSLPNEVLNKSPVVYVEKVDDYDILDWYSLVCNASEIYCVESSVHCFIDGCCGSEPIKSIPKFLLPRPSLPAGEKYTVSENWNLKYMNKGVE